MVSIGLAFFMIDNALILARTLTRATDFRLAMFTGGYSSVTAVPLALTISIPPPVPIVTFS